jgi:hypothetical protein
MPDSARPRPEDHPEEPAPGSPGPDGEPVPAAADELLAWSRALEVCRRRFVERRGAREIQDGLGIDPEYYESCMHWLLRRVMPRVSAGDCANGFDRRAIALAEADLVGIAAIQSVNDHVKTCTACAGYLRGLRSGAHVFITSAEPAEAAARAPYVVPSLHSSQLQGLRKRDGGSKRVGDVEPPSETRRASKRKRSRQANTPLVGLGAVAALAAAGATLVPGQPLSTADMQHATDDRERPHASRQHDRAPNVGAKANSFDAIAPPAVEEAAPPAPERLLVTAAEEQRTLAEQSDRSDWPEVSPPGVVGAPVVDLATHEAGIAAAKAHVLAAQHASNALPRASVDDDDAPVLYERASQGSTETAPARAELRAPAALAPVATLAAAATPAPSAPLPQELAIDAGDAGPAAPADTPSSEPAPADMHSESATIDTGADPPRTPGGPAPAVLPGVDMATITAKLDEAHEALRASLAENATRLQALLSETPALAAGDAPPSDPAPAPAPVEDAGVALPDVQVDAPEPPLDDVAEGSWPS